MRYSPRAERLLTLREQGERVVDLAKRCEVTTGRMYQILKQAKKQRLERMSVKGKVGECAELTAWMLGHFSECSLGVELDDADFDVVKITIKGRMAEGVEVGWGELIAIDRKWK